MTIYIEGNESSNGLTFLVFGALHSWLKSLYMYLLQDQHAYNPFGRLPKNFHGNYKGSFKKYVRWGEYGKGSLQSDQKRKGGGELLAFVYVHFFKKMPRFWKWSFIVILQFFLLIIMAVWNIKQIIMKDYNIQFCQWMTCDRFRQP